MMMLFGCKRAAALKATLARIAAANTEYEVIAQLRAFAREIGGADRAMILQRDGSDVVPLTEDSARALWMGRRFAFAGSLSAIALTTGEPVLIHDMTADARVPTDRYNPAEVRALAIYPVPPRHLIAVHWAVPCTPSAATRRRLSRLASGAKERIEQLERSMGGPQQPSMTRTARALESSGGAQR